MSKCRHWFAATLARIALATPAIGGGAGLLIDILTTGDSTRSAPSTVSALVTIGAPIIKTLAWFGLAYGAHTMATPAWRQGSPHSPPLVGS